MRKIAFTSALTFLALTGCAAPTPPSNPSWDQDVYPILRGSCLGCHGEITDTVKDSPLQAAFRFDVCDPGFVSEFGITLGTGGASLSTMIATSSDPAPGMKRMPPPPAAALSDYEKTVLKNWSNRVTKANGNLGDVCKKSSANHKPVVKLVSKKNEGGKVTATIDISDPDDDQVFGKATVGGGSAPIKSSGRREIVIENASGNSLEVKVSDGYESVTTSFNL